MNTQALMRAAQAGDAQTIANALDNDRSLIDTCDAHGWTMLCHAALNGHTELVRLLIERGADVRLNKPIHYSGQRQHKEICRLLVAAGAVDELLDSPNQNAVLAYRAMYSFDAEKLAKLLRKYPELVTVRQLDGSMMLHEAAINGAVDVLEAILSAGSEIDARNKRGETALDRAVLHEQIDAGRYLIDHGASCDLFTAAACNAVEKVAEAIDADPSLADARDENGLTLLETAMKLGQRDVVGLLLERGAKDPKGLAKPFLDGPALENSNSAGTLFRNVNLRGSVFQNVNLRNAVFHHLDLSDASIDDANISGLKIFGVEIAPLVEAELARKKGG